MSKKFLILSSVLFLGACSQNTANVEDTLSYDVPANQALTELEEDFTDSDVTTTRGPAPEDPLFAADTMITMQINGEPVQVYVWNTEADAEAAAATVQANGIIIGNRTFDWAAPAYFFKSGQIIAVYVGDDQATVAALDDELGNPFAENSGAFVPRTGTGTEATSTPAASTGAVPE